MITKAALLLFRENQGEKELLFARAKGQPYYVSPAVNKKLTKPLSKRFNANFKRN